MKWLTAFLVALALIAAPVHGYVDVSPSLGWIIKDATAITVFQVDKVSLEKKAILYKKVADLKGFFPDAEVRHHVAEGFHPREPKIVLDWAEPGKLAICFSSGKGAVICTGTYWYQVGATRDAWWRMTTGRPELSLAYYGPAEKLRKAVTEILAGKEVVITAINHGTQLGIYQYNNVAFQKVLRGKECPVWRIRASLDMPESVWRVSDRQSEWVVGTGAAGPEDVPALLKDLKDKSEAVRARAATDLGLVGWAAKDALPDLRKACSDPDPIVRIRAARAMVLIQEDDLSPVKVLQKELAHEKPEVRRRAATALGDLNQAAKSALPTLVEALRDDDERVRWAAASSISRIGSAAGPAVAALAQALRDPTIRVMAADALGAAGSQARGAVPLLIDALKSEDADYRWTAAVALSRIDPKAAKAALPLFIEKLQSDDHRARWDAMMYITPMGKEAKDAAPAVREIVKRGNGVAAATLAAIAGPDAEDALGVLLHILDDDWDTTENIAQIGPAAIPELLKMMNKPELKNRHLVVKALGLLAPKAPQCIPPLIDALKLEDKSIRKAAAVALGSLGAKAKDAIPELEKALNDEAPAVRLAVAHALRVIEGPVADPVPALVELLSHTTASVRRDASVGLAEFGAAAESALPALQRAVKDPDAGVRSAAALAIANITAAQAQRDAVQIMVQALKDQNPRARQDAARFLGNVSGHGSRTALTALAEARFDENEDVRRAAAEALAKIQAR
jgi:HEAT repeat protein